MKLSKLKIDNAKAESKARRISDGMGLYLLIQPNGSKLWQFRYRFRNNAKVFSIGKYPLVSLADARKERDRLRLTLQSGVDPMQKKETTIPLQEILFSECADRWFDVWKVNISDRHRKNNRNRLENDILPFLGKKFVGEITRAEIRNVIKVVGDRQATDLAGRILNIIQAIFTFALDEEIVQTNPAGSLRAKTIVGVRRTENYSRIDAKEIPELLQRINDYEGRPITRYALKILMLTFVRTSELLNSRWEEFDLKKKEWRIPKERMKSRKEHIVPLSNQVIRSLDGLRKKSGQQEYLFVGDRTNKPISNNTLLRALERMGYKGKMTGHGFRGLASTVLHENGFEHLHIEKQLAHNPKDAITHAYNHADYLKQRTEMMQWWAEYVDGKKEMRLVVGGNG